jgi:RNA polymerase sigma-70 factor (ECF subfamily)
MNLEEFYDEHIDKVYRFFYFKSLNVHTAEDLTSQTFLAFVEQTSIREIDEPTKYLYGVMRNIWLGFLRAKYESVLADLVDIDNFEDYVSTVNDQESSEDLPQRLRKYIELLPEKQRKVLVMRVINDMSVKDIAKELGKDRNYVKTTYKRAIASLRSIIKEPYMWGERKLEL